MMTRRTNLMDKKLYNKKGLTFKGAFAVVIFVHIVGICSLYGYSKYKSNQLRIAREEWKNKIEQRDSNNQSEWNTKGMFSKIVARPCPKIPTEVKQNTNPSILIEKAQQLTGAFLSKASTEINVALKDINKKEKPQVQTQTVSTLSTIKKKQEPPKTEKLVNKVTVVPHKIPTFKPPTPVTVRVVPRSIEAVPSASNYQTVSKPKPIVNQHRLPQPQSKPRLRTYDEFDYETQETVRTFYSY